MAITKNKWNEIAKKIDLVLCNTTKKTHVEISGYRVREVVFIAGEYIVQGDTKSFDRWDFDSAKKFYADSLMIYADLDDLEMLIEWKPSVKSSFPRERS